MRGRASLHLWLVAPVLLLQVAEIGGAFVLLGLPAAWAVPPLCFAALGASLGFAAAQARDADGWRAVAADAARLGGPAYLFAILGAVLLIGSWSSSDGARDYFTDGSTYEYLLNLVGWPHFFLPGVFEFNDVFGVVNRNVWAAPVAVLLLAAACWRSGRRFLRAAPAALAAALALGVLMAEALAVSLGPAPNAAEIMLRGDGLSALLGGLLGVALFRGRRRVPLDGRLAAGAIALLALLALGGAPSWAASAWFRVVCAVPAAYAVLYLSVRRFARLRWALSVQPYLPPLFLLTFPVGQLVVELGPVRQNPLLSVALAAGAAVAASALLARLVARRLLGERLRDRLTGREDGAAAAPWRRPSLRIALRPLLAHLAVGAVFLALCLALMLAMYLAFTPDPPGL